MNATPTTAEFPQHRDEFGSWLNSNGLVGEGAEIGCAFGGYASKVLSQWKGTMYYMVDPWIKQPSSVYRERTDGIDYDKWYDNCLQLAEEDNRVKIIRGYSVDVAKTIPDSQLDFAYIDGNHCYDAVWDDMNSWWPKVKISGILCGHDFYDSKSDGHYCEVESAVTRWSKENNLKFACSPCSSWWIIKTHN